MVINIRGTHGSGKTTVVRRVMEEYEKKQPMFIERRQRPFSYVCSSPGKRVLYVPGSYENPTGGCDTIPSIEMIFDAVREAAGFGMQVLFEGIVAQHAFQRVFALKELGLSILVLNTDLKTCIESVKVRRAERGKNGDFDPKNVEKEYKSVQSAARRLTANGVDLHYVSRDEAFDFCMSRLMQ